MFLRISRLSLLPILVVGCFFVSSYLVEGSHTNTVQTARISWQKFLSAHGQAWKATWSDKGRLKTIRGSRYRLIAGEPKGIARQFLIENAGLFQLSSGLGDLEVRRVTQSLSGNHVEFQQTYRGLPVIGGTIEVHSDMQGRVFLAHNNYVPSITIPVTPIRSDNRAGALAIGNFRSFIGNKPGASSILVVRTDLGIYDTDQGPQLVHRIILRSEPRVIMREYIVSDVSGVLLKQRPLDQDSVTGKGKVFDPNPVNTLNDTSLTDQNDSDAAVPAGAYFTKDLQGLSDAVGGNFSLSGSYVKMEDIESPSNTPPSIADKDLFLFTRNSDNFEEVMCYFHIDRNQRYIQSLGFTDINNRQHRVDAHGLNGDLNAHYVASPIGSGYLAFGDGGVDLAEDADVILHEYGHSIQDNSSNGAYLGSEETGAMGEGFGDYWAASNSPSGFDVACIGEWVAAPSCTRRVDSTKHYPEGITHEVHSDGEIWSGALWDLYQSLGKATTDKLVLESHFLVGADPKFKDGAQALLDADEMLFDGDHTDVICEKMGKRGILACLDLIFVIDTTGSMFDDIAAVKAAATDIVNELDSKNLDYRMAVVSYEDFPVSPFGDASCGDATFHDVLEFTDNKAQIISGIQGLFLRCGADTPEAVFSGLTHAIDSSSLGSWRNNVTKAIILMGDAPGHNPEPFTGFTPATVIAAAEAADPVVIFPIVIGFDSQAKSQFQALAAGTGGQLFEAPTANEVVAAIIAAINSIVQPSCTITCPADIVRTNEPLQCGAVVTYPGPTASAGCGTVTCGPASGSFFSKGTTTVTCSTTAGPSCTFTITVVDTQPPTIACPANVTAVTNQTACSSPACQTVNYAVPTASDNCGVASVVCNPPASSCFSTGVTTVTCTATDTSANTATCSFTVTVFDVAVQDDSNPAIILLWNSISGQYRFCCNGTTYTGVGKSTVKGCLYTFETPNATDRRISGKVDKALHTGSGAVQNPPGITRCTITDRNTLNDTNVTSCR